MHAGCRYLTSGLQQRLGALLPLPVYQYRFSHWRKEGQSLRSCGQRRPEQQSSCRLHAQASRRLVICAASALEERTEEVTSLSNPLGTVFLLWSRNLQSAGPVAGSRRLPDYPGCCSVEPKRRYAISWLKCFADEVDA